MKRFMLILMLFSLVLSSPGAEDQDKDCNGRITPEVISRLHARIPGDDAFRAISSALRNRDFTEVFANPEVLRNHNHHYTNDIKTGDITDQKGTGRCWMYAALNTIRPYVVRRLEMDDFEFSTAYLFFWDKLEKANAFLERAIARSGKELRDPEWLRTIANPVDDGGYWQNCVDLVEKYGVVPMAAMPETASTANSRQMNRALTWILRNHALSLRRMHAEGSDRQALRNRKEEFLAQVYRVLVMHLGEPVQSFPFRYRRKNKKSGEKEWTAMETYTPMTFMKRFVSPDLERFVMVANWPSRPMYSYYQWEDSNNVFGGRRLDFINLPMKKIKEMMVASILDDTPVNFSADVGKQLDNKHGIMHADLYPFSRIYGVEFPDDKGTNTVLRNINSTHAMVIMGVDLVEGKPLKWKVENSWGSDRGHKGYYAMYDNWFDRYVVRVVLDRKYVTPEILELLDTKPLLIPFTEPEQ